MNVSSVKNLNGETFSAVQDLSLTNVVQTNSAVLTGMIDAKQDTLTFGYDEQDRINSINNSALAGGGAVSANAPLSGDGSNSQPLGIDPNVILPYPMQLVATQEEASGTNILYVVTGTGA